MVEAFEGIFKKILIGYIIVKFSVKDEFGNISYRHQQGSGIIIYRTSATSVGILTACHNLMYPLQVAGK